MVAPFLAHRIWKRPAFPAELVECGRCTFQFFIPRMDSVEEGRLYTGYRGPEYQRDRQSVEPWYTAKFNADLSHPSLMRERKEKLTALFREHLSDRHITSILDFGGDR